MLLHRLQPFATVTMSLTASRLSGYNTIGERRIEEKCKEQRIGKIKSIGRCTAWNFTSYTTIVSKAESCRTASFGEHSLPVLLSQTEKCSISSPIIVGVLTFHYFQSAQADNEVVDSRIPSKHDIISCMAVGSRWVTTHPNLQVRNPFFSRNQCCNQAIRSRANKKFRGKGLGLEADK